MPRPHPGESRKHYIKRAIPLFKEEGYSQKEAVGRAYGFWRSYGGKKKKAIPERKR